MNETYIQDIRLHLGHTIPSSVSVVQYDTARELHFYIDDYIVPNEAEIRIYIRKPSGKEIYNHCLLVEDEIIMYPTTQMFAECGLNLAQIQIVKNNKTLTSFRFDIEVSESYAENAIPSTNEFTILDALIIEAREIIKAEAEDQRIESENNRISAETNRANAENAREAAARKRQEDTENAIDNCNIATSNANIAAQNAKDAAENANSVSEELERKAQNGDVALD